MIVLGVDTKFIQPSIEILSLRIDEPITTITDIFLGIICLIAFVRIGKLENSGKGGWYFKFYFLLLGLGAISGGLLGHAFLYRLAEEWKLVSWCLTLISVALLIQALVEVSRSVFKKNVLRIFSWFNILIFTLALFLTLRSLDFNPVKYYSLFGLVVMAGSICFYIYHRTGNKGVLILMTGVGIGILSAIVFSLEWGLSAWFNHRDVSHIILCLSVYLIYRGTRRILQSILRSGA